MNSFKLISKFKPSGDQPQAIDLLTKGLEKKMKYQTLLGVTGSGKTYTMASVIENVNKPTLIISHNKTLAAQLFSEFKTFFPENSVCYFVSYYDYYQPEAYVPKKDLFIEKETDINEDIERYRSASTQALLSRKDVIIVASVSCIYGLGNPDDYSQLSVNIKKGELYNREKLIRHLSDLQYQRSEYDFYNGLYRVRGDTIDIFTATENNTVRIEFFGDNIENIKIINTISGEILFSPETIQIFPAKHYVTQYDALMDSIPRIETELKERIDYFKRNNRLLEAQRIEQRVRYDIEMLTETGYCSGIENYSRFIDNREPGVPPSTLIDYFPDDFLLFIDESHMTVSQIRGMYNGDRARKETLVEYGFRLPSALDNRPLKYEEFNKLLNQTIFVSATPSEYELSLSQKQSIEYKSPAVIEQIIRPTGLLDPIIKVFPQEGSKLEKLKQNLKKENLNNQIKYLENYQNINQIDDLLIRVKNVIAKKQRVLITTLTKRLAEDLSSYLKELKIKVNYLHSEIDTVERVEILRDLRLGKYDVVVGINLLREGIDLPEVSLVIILDADKEGFLRSEVSLIQTIGRSSRNVDAEVIMYAENITKSMKNAIVETERRRKIQEDYNTKNNITPRTIQKEIVSQLERSQVKDEVIKDKTLEEKINSYKILSKKERKLILEELRVQMLLYSDMMEFEKAAEIRDIINNLKSKQS